MSVRYIVPAELATIQAQAQETFDHRSAVCFGQIVDLTSYYTDTAEHHVLEVRAAPDACNVTDAPSSFDGLALVACRSFSDPREAINAWAKYLLHRATVHYPYYQPDGNESA